MPTKVPILIDLGMQFPNRKKYIQTTSCVNTEVTSQIESDAQLKNPIK